MDLLILQTEVHLIYMVFLMGDIKNIFNLNTSFSSHELEIYLNNVIISNKEVDISKFYLEKAKHNEYSNKSFALAWTVPIKKSELKYVWDNELKEYKKITEKNNTEINCKSLVRW